MKLPSDDLSLVRSLWALGQNNAAIAATTGYLQYRVDFMVQLLGLTPNP